MGSRAKKSLLALAIMLLMGPYALAAPTVAVSPAAISSTTQTDVVISVTGLTTAGDVTIEQIYDVNQNGIIDAGDPVFRSYVMTEGTMSSNLNVQGDEDGFPDGNLTTTLNYHSLVNGKYRAPGMHFFRVTDVAGAVSDSASFTVTQVSAAQSISGTVVDPSQNPLPGVPVVLFDEAEDIDKYFAVSDANGNFTIYAGEPGTYIVAPFPDPPYYLKESGAYFTDLTAGQNLTGITVEVGSGGYQVSGRVVVEGTSTGVPGIDVSFEIDETSPDFVFVSDVTDADGNFSVQLPNGTYDAWLGTDNPTFSPGNLELIASDSSYTFVVDNAPVVIPDAELTPTTHLITGQVLDDDNMPVAGLEIRASSWDAPTQPRTTTYTNSNGEFHLGVFATGYGWNVEMDNGSDNAVNRRYIGSNIWMEDLTDITGLEIEVKIPTATINGTLYDNFGSPVSWEWVQASLPNWNWSHGTEALDAGNFSLPVFAGEWVFTPWPNGCLNAVFIEDGETLNLDLNYDGDLYGACDPDIDGDGVANDWDYGAFDNCPATPNADQGDVDWNNIGDACDTGDYDEDGLRDYQEVQAGTDVNNPDTDGDGLIDSVDPQPLVAEGAIATPNGGEMLGAGSVHDIQWAPVSGADHYTVRLSINGGASFWNLATNVTGNSYSWTVDNVSTAGAIIRVVAYDSGNDWLASNDSDAPFSIVKYGSLLTPNGGELYSGGETVFVDWVDHPQAVSYKVRISIDGGTKFWTLQDGITESQANITLPNLTSNFVLLKVVAYGPGSSWLAADNSDAVFRIIKGGTVLTPNGGGYYYTGNQLNITWAVHPSATHYVVRFSINGGESYWTLPGGSNVTDTSFDWTLPAWMNSADCMVLIQTWNGGSWIAADHSDSTFVVQP